jgi:hypothetical protein
MGDTTRWLRARALATDWFEVLVVAGLVLALAGGYAAATAHAAPGTTTETEPVTRWTVEGDLSHSATVTNENPVFERGTTLRDRAVYFTAASPVLNVTHAVTYRDAGTSDGNATVAANATLVLQSKSEDRVLWTERVPLATTEASLASGDTATVAAAVNVTDTRERIAAIREGLGDAPGEVSATVVVSATAITESGRAAGYEQRVPLTLGAATYEVGSVQPARDAATTTRTVTVARSYGPLWTVGGPLVFALGVLVLAGLAAARSTGALGLSAAERDYLAYRDDRAEFAEWVVRARLPDSVHDRERADAESLADLVDYAIDADAGVVEETATGTYYVATADLVVAFDPPPEPPDPRGGLRLRSEDFEEPRADRATGESTTEDAGDGSDRVTGDAVDDGEAGERAA